MAWALLAAAAAMVGSGAPCGQHASELHHNGFTVVPTPLLPPPSVSLLSSSVTSRLSHLLCEVRSLGYDTEEQAYLFNEVCHRQRYRWDLRPDFSQDDASRAWASLCEEALTRASPIIREAQAIGRREAQAIGREGASRGREAASLTEGEALSTPKLIMSGAVVSRPGCAAQRFHTDATESHVLRAASEAHHRLYTAFVPLVDVAPDSDGTQFWMGSHEARAMEVARRSITRDGDLRSTAASAPLSSPGCPAGGLILFDYRVLHRGLASIGRERPVAYIVCGTGGAWDEANFPQLSIDNPAAARYADETPSWSDIEEVYAST